MKSTNQRHTNPQQLIKGLRDNEIQLDCHSSTALIILDVESTNNPTTLTRFGVHIKPSRRFPHYGIWEWQSNTLPEQGRGLPQDSDFHDSAPQSPINTLEGFSWNHGPDSPLFASTSDFKHAVSVEMRPRPVQEFHSSSDDSFGAVQVREYSMHISLVDFQAEVDETFTQKSSKKEKKKGKKSKKARRSLSRVEDEEDSHNLPNRLTSTNLDSVSSVQPWIRSGHLPIPWRQDEVRRPTDDNELIDEAIEAVAANSHDFEVVEDSDVANRPGGFHNRRSQSEYGGRKNRRPHSIVEQRYARSEAGLLKKRHYSSYQTSSSRYKTLSHYLSGSSYGSGTSFEYGVSTITNGIQKLSEWFG